MWRRRTVQVQSIEQSTLTNMDKDEWTLWLLAVDVCGAGAYHDGDMNQVRFFYDWGWDISDGCFAAGVPVNAGGW